MKNWIHKGLLGLWIGVFLVAGVSRSFGNPVDQDIQQLKQLIEKQAVTIKALKDRLAKIEANQKEVEVKVSSRETFKEQLPEWISRIKLHGDFRYRHEYIDEEGEDNRTRHRIRTRIGMDAKVNDDIDFYFRLASGSTDPVSTNQTLTGGYTSKSIWIDRAYVDWHPTFANTCGHKGHLILGKIKNPFLMVKSSSLIWDDDLSPEGGAITYQAKLGKINPFINLGGFWVEERDKCYSGRWLL